MEKLFIRAHSRLVKFSLGGFSFCKSRSLTRSALKKAKDFRILSGSLVIELLKRTTSSTANECSWGGGNSNNWCIPKAEGKLAFLFTSFVDTDNADPTVFKPVVYSHRFFKRKYPTTTDSNLITDLWFVVSDKQMDLDLLFLAQENSPYLVFAFEI